MQVALEFAAKLLGDSPMARKLQHPDLHFAFPVFKRKSEKAVVSDDFLAEWREICTERRFFGLAEWMSFAGAENQQLTIYAAESDNINRKLALKSSQGGRKVVVMWLPEKMQETCANKLLKLLEEPPSLTNFILVSENPEQVLLTIRSRTQMIPLPPLTTEEIRDELCASHSVMPDDAARIAHAANGNMVAALRQITADADSEFFFQKFVDLMRLAYVRKVKEMKQWSEEVAGMGRERQKNFVAYCQHMLRENFMYNFQCHDQLNFMNERESQFAVKFAPFINENNVFGIMDELSLVMRDIGQNANPKIVFFDFSLKMILLIKNR